MTRPPKSMRPPWNAMMPETAHLRSQYPLPPKKQFTAMTTNPAGHPMSTYARWPVVSAGTITTGRKRVSWQAVFHKNQSRMLERRNGRGSRKQSNDSIQVRCAPTFM